MSRPPDAPGPSRVLPHERAHTSHTLAGGEHPVSVHECVWTRRANQQRQPRGVVRGGGRACTASLVAADPLSSARIRELRQQSLAKATTESGRRWPSARALARRRCLPRWRSVRRAPRCRRGRRALSVRIGQDWTSGGGPKCQILTLGWRPRGEVVLRPGRKVGHRTGKGTPQPRAYCWAHWTRWPPPPPPSSSSSYDSSGRLSL